MHKVSHDCTDLYTEDLRHQIDLASANLKLSITHNYSSIIQQQQAICTCAPVWQQQVKACFQLAAGDKYGPDTTCSRFDDNLPPSSPGDICPTAANKNCISQLLIQ